MGVGPGAADSLSFGMRIVIGILVDRAANPVRCLAREFHIMLS